MRESSAPIDYEPLISVVKRESAPSVIEEVFAQRLPSLYRTAYRFLGNSADAEDAVQDALLSAYKHLHEFRGESQLSTWLTVIVSNCARMRLRSRPRKKTAVSMIHPIGQRPLTIPSTAADKAARVGIPYPKTATRSMKSRVRPPET